MRDGDGGGRRGDVRYDLVFVGELELGREIVEGFFFLLSMSMMMGENGVQRVSTHRERLESVLDPS